MPKKSQQNKILAKFSKRGRISIYLCLIYFSPVKAELEALRSLHVMMLIKFYVVLLNRFKNAFNSSFQRPNFFPRSRQSWQNRSKNSKKRRQHLYIYSQLYYRLRLCTMWSTIRGLSYFTERLLDGQT